MNAGAARWIERFGRSVLVQVALATLLFVGIGLYLIAAPLRDFPAYAEPDLRSLTLDGVAGAIHLEIAEGRGPTETATAIAQDPLVTQVRARNPGFRYSVTMGDTRFGTGEPRHYEALGLDRITAAKRQADPDICIQTERRFPAADGLEDYAFYRFCETLEYIEISGIETPIALDIPGPLEGYGDRLWFLGSDFLIASLGVFAILCLILVAHFVQFRREARRIRPHDDDRGLTPLRERRFPTEIRPLIAALNRVISAAEQDEARRRFFLSAAAHEMRTPLTVLRTRVEMLAEDPAKHELIADTRRLSGLVNRLLTLMSIGQRAREFERVDLAQCTRRVIEALKPHAAREGVELELRIEGAGPVVMGDWQLLDIAISNLVSNAISFSPRGETVSIAIEPDGGLSVRDRGPGIPGEQVDALFEPFIRYSEGRDGYGLGLAIAKAVTDLHGASLHARNAAEGGAIFTLGFENDGE